MNKFAKAIKYIFVVALIAFLAALLLRICQSDYKAFKDVYISDGFKAAYKVDSNVRTHAVNDGFSENGGVFAYSLVYMEDAGYIQFTVRYNIRHMDEVRETYPDFKDEDIYYILQDNDGNTYTPNVLETEEKYNYRFFKLEFTDIESFEKDLKIKMILGGTPDNVSAQNILTVHRGDDTSIAYDFSSSELKKLNK